MFLADLTDMKLFRWGWPKLAPRLEPLKGKSAIIESDGGMDCVDGVELPGCAIEPDSAGDPGIVGVELAIAACPEVGGANGEGTWVAVVGRRVREWIESAVVGRWADSVAVAKAPSPKGRSSVRVDSRLVTLSQLTGRTRVLACVRATGEGMPSMARGLIGSFDDKAALSLLKRVPTFLSPGSETKDFLLSASWVWALVLLSSNSLCFLILFSSFFFLSSSLLRCRSASRDAGLGRSS